MIKKRCKPCSHKRRLKTGRTVTVNKGVKKKVPYKNKKLALKEITVLMSENRSLARKRGSIIDRQDNLHPLSLESRDRMDLEENKLQRKGRSNRAKIKFLEKKYDLNIK